MCDTTVWLNNEEITENTYSGRVSLGASSVCSFSDRFWSTEAFNGDFGDFLKMNKWVTRQFD